MPKTKKTLKWRFLKLVQPKDDPIYNCPVFIKEGCTDIDGLRCNMDICVKMILYRENKKQK